MLARKSLSLLILGGLLAGCGGGGTSQPNTQQGAGPTPTPTPSPTPTSTPTPSPTYSQPFDFSADFSYGLMTIELQRAGQIVAGRFVPDNDARNLDDRAETKFVSWNAANQEITLDHSGDVSIFGQMHIISTQPDGTRWRILSAAPYRDDILSVFKPRDDIEYVLGTYQELEYDATDGTGKRLTFDRFGLGGSLTETGDLPARGTRSYELISLTTSPTRDGAGGFVTASVASFDFSDTDFNAIIEFRQVSSIGGNDPITFTAELSGSFDRADERITGTVTSPNSGYSGGFSAAFFGPQAEEIGIVLSFDDPALIPVAGFLAGDSSGN